MRIAIVAPPWLPVPPSGYGGTETVLDGLARGLSQRGHDVLLFTTGDSTCPVERRWVFGRSIGTAAATPAAELRQVIAAYDCIGSWGADIVHDHTLTGPLYGERFEVPVVTTIHGPLRGELAGYYRAVSSSTSLVAISQSQADEDPSVPVADVIHHGIDVDPMPFGEGGGGFALFLARMNPDKGPDLAIAAAREAGVPLKIAAKLQDPEEIEFFETTVEPLLGDGVEYLGEATAEEKLELLADARCLLAPIRWREPFGMSIIEALACGTPVVATPRGSLPELIEDGVTGFLGSTIPELADGLRAVGELDRTLCRKVASTRFSTDRMVSDHIELYRSILDRSR